MFVRTGNELSATSVARSMREPLRALLTSAEHLVFGALPFDPGTLSRPVMLASTDIAETVVLPRLIPLLRRRAPTLDVVTTIASDVNRALHDGAIDLALGIMGRSGAGITYQPLFEAPRRCPSCSRRRPTSCRRRCCWRRWRRGPRSRPRRRGRGRCEWSRSKGCASRGPRVIRRRAARAASGMSARMQPPRATSQRILSIAPIDGVHRSSTPSWRTPASWARTSSPSRPRAHRRRINLRANRRMGTRGAFRSAVIRL